MAISISKINFNYLDFKINSIKGIVVSSSVQQEFHCSCCAPNETLAVMGCL
ncbi:hypothetical protein [Flavobacterium alvei]|uniref:hypothetical protein n=1 Tax=Flavobacterium alvei TaxID=2080416 RepID=UPI0013FD7BF8|nr:hypothetical protein [Flavobacterium alvei]